MLGIVGMHTPTLLTRVDERCTQVEKVEKDKEEKKENYGICYHNGFAYHCR